ncbi:MAG TPA: hypothetical protein DEF51_18610, partial [Myxococcales bacterium]|nr:hypothetical protein [Myxococcales bacterium]
VTEPRIELVYDADCPNVEAARESLERVLGQLGLPVRWREHVSSDAPARLRGLGSPTILVDGRDVSGERAPSSCCRLYASADGRLSPVPDDADIARALRA